MRTRAAITAEIAAAYVGANAMPAAELPKLIEAVHAKVAALMTGESPAPAAIPPSPAVPIAKSITPDFLICLETGKRFRSLKRHLGALGMTPDAYRAKWDLPPNYPMAAPAYSAVRSQLAKGIGLGRGGVAA